MQREESNLSIFSYYLAVILFTKKLVMASVTIHSSVLLPYSPVCVTSLLSIFIHRRNEACGEEKKKKLEAL